MADDFVDALLDLDGTDWIESATADVLREARKAGHLRQLLENHHDDEAAP